MREGYSPYFVVEPGVKTIKLYIRLTIELQILGTLVGEG